MPASTAGVLPRLQTAAISAPTGMSSPLSDTYARAVETSAIFETSKQVSNLVPIGRGTTVVSLSSCFACGTCSQCRASGAACSSECAGCSRKCSLTNGAHAVPTDVWVTPSAELLEVCRAFPIDGAILGLQQWLGLPPNLAQPPDSWKLLFIRIDDPAELFRPCTESNPTTPGPCTETFPESATESHRAWMAGQAFASWQLPGGYPWTRLGYTFNWNPDAATTVGASEYVIPRGKTVNVLGFERVLDARSAPSP